MPLRAYTPSQPPCRLCGMGFEVMQSARDPALAECPRCGGPVHPRTDSPVHSPRVSQPASASEAKAAGFTVLKRIGDGEYEKQ